MKDIRNQTDQPIYVVSPFKGEDLAAVQAAAEIAGVSYEASTSPEQAAVMMRDEVYRTRESEHFNFTIDSVAEAHAQTGRECAQNGGAVVRLTQYTPGEDLSVFWSELRRIRDANKG